MSEFMMRVDVRLSGTNKKYFEEQKKRLGETKTSNVLKKILNEHKSLTK